MKRLAVIRKGKNTKYLVLLRFSETAEVFKELINNTDRDHYDNEEEEQNIYQEVLEPVEIMGDRPHIRVVRMSQEILQPPNGPV